VTLHDVVKRNPETTDGKRDREMIEADFNRWQMDPILGVAIELANISEQFKHCYDTSSLTAIRWNDTMINISCSQLTKDTTPVKCEPWIKFDHG